LPDEFLPFANERRARRWGAAAVDEQRHFAFGGEDAPMHPLVVVVQPGSLAQEDVIGRRGQDVAKSIRPAGERLNQARTVNARDKQNQDGPRDSAKRCFDVKRIRRAVCLSLCHAAHRSLADVFL
jgi:hypothetical protein